MDAYSGVFICPDCGASLQPELRLRPLFLTVFMVFAAMSRMHTFVVNPRVNAEKTSKLPLIIEGGLVHLLRHTRLVRLEPHHRSSNSESEST